MLVLLHVIIALSSLVYTTYLFIRPSTTKFYVNYGFIGATLVSGTYLVVSTHAPMLGSCVAGLIYLGVVTIGTVSAHHRLVSVKVKK